MAGYPPPYPYGFDARTQRRMMRAQARAQSDAVRAQRDLYRRQMRASRRSSILGPLLLVGIGVGVLVVRARHLTYEQTMLAYGRWWPTLLVGSGLVLVAEWLFDQRRSVAGQPVVRRGLGAGGVLLLLLVLLSGAAASAYQHSGGSFNGFAITPENIGEVFGEKHEREQQLDQAVPAGATILINNPHGDIVIAGRSADDQIHVTVAQEIYALSDRDADDKAREANAQLTQSGNTVNLTVPSVYGASSNLTITLPETCATTVNAGHGNVSVSAVRAPVSVTASHGDVTLNLIAGGVTVNAGNRNSSVSARSIDGKVEVHGRADDLNLSDVSGAVKLAGDFYGETHLERVKGPVEFSTSRTQFALARLDGTVDISPDSELTGSQIVGPTSLHTRSRTISLSGLAGDVAVENSNGGVELTGAASLGNVRVRTTNGNVTVALPGHADFSVDAQTRHGEIENQFGLTSTGNDRDAQLTGTIGTGGMKVDLATSHADIALNRASEMAEAPPPAPAAGRPSREKHAPAATRELPLTPAPAQP